MTRRIPDHIRNGLMAATASDARVAHKPPSEPSRLDQRIAEEAGEVRETIDLAVFEWLHPQAVGRRQRPPGLTITQQAIALTPAAMRLIGEPERVAIGLAPRAIAIRPAQHGDGYAVVRKRRGGRAVGGGQIMSRALVTTLVERGWPQGQMIPVRYDEGHRLLLAVLPRGREGGV